MLAFLGWPFLPNGFEGKGECRSAEMLQSFPFWLVTIKQLGKQLKINRVVLELLFFKQCKNTYSKETNVCYLHPWKGKGTMGNEVSKHI